MNKKTAVVCLSGGLDSTTCLAYAQSKDYDCFTLGFDYGQRHIAELNAAKNIADSNGVLDHKVISIKTGDFSSSALTDTTINVPEYKGDGEIPVTYVPARNTIFLSYALGYAEVIKAQAIFIGVSCEDYSGYPDCRPEYIKAFQEVANLATKSAADGNRVEIITPLMYLNKAQTIELGVSLGVDYSHTVSCYQANESGLACAKCDSCYLRQRGFKEAGIKDPTRYINRVNAQ